MPICRRDCGLIRLLQSRLRSGVSWEIPARRKPSALTRICCSSPWPERITSSRGSIGDRLHCLNAFINHVDHQPASEAGRDHRGHGRILATPVSQRYANVLTNSRRTSAMTSLTMSLTSSGTFCISVLLASARTPRRRRLARLASLSAQSHTPERRAAAKSGVRRYRARRRAASAFDTVGEAAGYSWAMDFI